MEGSTIKIDELALKHCQPCDGGTPAMEPAKVAELLEQLDGWEHSENHHPDLEVGYNTCMVNYTTHAIAGLSENDFICAAKVDALLTE